MKKLKNSVKYVLIAGVSLVCVLAIVLGCVFGLKKKDNTGGNGGAGSPASLLTQAQQKLAKEVIENNNKLDYQIYDAVPYAGVCSYNQVTMLGRNYTWRFCNKIGYGTSESFLRFLLQYWRRSLLLRI